MTVKLSRTSKLGCLSWSLQALDTCPGSKAADGTLVEACRGCYATTGNYRYQNVIAPREFNRTDWQREEWVAEMVDALQNERYFRWFDSGDVYSLRLLFKIQAVVRLTPWCNHWLPTRMHKFPKFASVIADLETLPNIVVRRSLDDVYVDSFTMPLSETHSAIIADPSVPVSDGVTVCHAYERDGKCGTCRACWDKSVTAIAYPAHGVKMSKVIRLKVA